MCKGPEIGMSRYFSKGSKQNPLALDPNAGRSRQARSSTVNTNVRT